MRTRALDGLLTAGVLVAFSGLCHAHGGIYRGPGDVVPPVPGGGGGGGGGSGTPTGPTTGQPTGPAVPTPAGPTTPGSGNPTTGTGQPAATTPSPTTPRGVQLDPDLTEWRFWWEFNKDAFLRLKDAVHEGSPETGSDDAFFLGPTQRKLSRSLMTPTDGQIMGEILPALKKAIDSTEQRDIHSSCMVAMAKIGTNHPDFKLIDVFKPSLRKPDQEIREVAALAIGIAAIAGEEEVNLLVDLALDQPKARDATGGSIDHRTRSFATYGLGLLAHDTGKTEIKAQAFAALRKLLSDDRASDRNIRVAAINAIGILDIDGSTAADQQLLADALQCLEDYYLQSLGAGHQLIQSHCPTAIAKLIGRDHPRCDHFKQLFAADLQEKGKVKRSSHDIARSCAMALGMMVQPHDDKDLKQCPDAVYSKLLLDTYHGHKDAQTRNFALLGLGQIGGARNREVLLAEFDKGKNLELPWCSLALGIYAFSQHQQHPQQDPDRLIGTTLTDALKRARDPSVVGALAIGLGLSQTRAAADTMRSILLDNVAKEEMAGYLCVGLALMDDRMSKEDIHRVLQTSVRRDTLLRQTAVALGKLGDKQVAEDLLKLLDSQGDNNLAKLASIASALGLIGDQRTIRPLIRMLFDSKLGDLSRAFAAVALGGVADKEPLPWSAKLSTNMNYRAAVETLTNRSAGILDIL